MQLAFGQLENEWWNICPLVGFVSFSIKVDFWRILSKIPHAGKPEGANSGPEPCQSQKHKVVDLTFLRNLMRVTAYK